MSIRSIIITVAIAAFLLSVVYVQHLRTAVERAEAKNKTLIIENQSVRDSEAAIRNQYDVINLVLADREDKRRESERQVTELKDKLKNAQKDTPCAAASVPDSVTQRLRERATEINAAATSSRKSI